MAATDLVRLSFRVIRWKGLCKKSNACRWALFDRGESLASQKRDFPPIST
jgi:hypothetical protein